MRNMFCKILFTHDSYLPIYMHAVSRVFSIHYVIVTRRRFTFLSNAICDLLLMFHVFVDTRCRWLVSVFIRFIISLAQCMRAAKQCAATASNWLFVLICTQIIMRRFSRTYALCVTYS